MKSFRALSFILDALCYTFNIFTKYIDGITLGYIDNVTHYKRRLKNEYFKHSKQLLKKLR